MTDVIEFKINDQVVKVEASDGDMTLIDYLHEHQNLTGTKFSCGIGVCRSCTVATRAPDSNSLGTTLSCLTRLFELSGFNVYTVESLGTEQKLAALQKAFLEHFSFQCGYCAPGFLMAAEAMLDQIRKKPITKEQLDNLIEGYVGSNLCRCTGYVSYIEAIREVASEMIKNK